LHVTLADREAELMAVLWNRGPSTVAEVREQLSVELAYTTVLTILRNLESKGYVAHGTDGRAHRYAALVAKDAARNSALKDLAVKFFGGSAEQLMRHLVPGHELSVAETKRIRELLESEKTKGRR
jgi:BlaI family transcriptional regulator, penicillinase repressor